MRTPPQGPPRAAPRPAGWLVGGLAASVLLHAAAMAALLLWHDRREMPGAAEGAGVALVFVDTAPLAGDAAAGTGTPAARQQTAAAPPGAQPVPPDAPPSPPAAPEGAVPPAAAQPPAAAEALPAEPDAAAPPAETARARVASLPRPPRDGSAASAPGPARSLPAAPQPGAEALPLPPPPPDPTVAERPPPAPQRVAQRPPAPRLETQPGADAVRLGAGAAALPDASLGARAIGAVVPPGADAGHSNPPPDYPPESRRRGEEGVVRLALRIGADGRVQAAEVTGTSGHPALDRAALAAARRWRFRPATQGGLPVPATLPTAVHFRLTEAGGR